MEQIESEFMMMVIYSKLLIIIPVRYLELTKVGSCITLSLPHQKQ